MEEIRELEPFVREPILRKDYHSQATSICFCLTQYAKNYLKKEQANELGVKSTLRNAILVDAINYVGLKNGFEFGLDINYLLSNETDNDIIDSKLLLNVILKEFGNYLGNENIETSIIEHQAFTNYKFGFDSIAGEEVLFDFIRYIAMENDYDIENELGCLKRQLMRKKYHDQDKICDYQMRLENKSLDEIFEEELHAMILAFLNSDNNIDEIENGMLKNKVLTIKKIAFDD